MRDYSKKFSKNFGKTPRFSLLVGGKENCHFPNQIKGETNMNKTSIDYTREDAKELLRLLDEFLAIKGETNSPEGKLLKKCMLDGFRREFGEVSGDA